MTFTGVPVDCLFWEEAACLLHEKLWPEPMPYHLFSSAFLGKGPHFISERRRYLGYQILVDGLKAGHFFTWKISPGHNQPIREAQPDKFWGIENIYKSDAVENGHTSPEHQTNFFREEDIKLLLSNDSVEVLKSTYSPELAMRLVDLWEMAGARKYPEFNAFAKQTLGALFDGEIGCILKPGADYHILGDGLSAQNGSWDRISSTGIRFGKLEPSLEHNFTKMPLQKNALIERLIPNFSTYALELTEAIRLCEKLKLSMPDCLSRHIEASADAADVVIHSGPTTKKDIERTAKNVLAEIKRNGWRLSTKEVARFVSVMTGVTKARAESIVRPLRKADPHWRPGTLKKGEKSVDYKKLGTALGIPSSQIPKPPQ